MINGPFLIIECDNDDCSMMDRVRFSAKDFSKKGIELPPGWIEAHFDGDLIIRHFCSDDCQEDYEDDQGYIGVRVA